MAAISLAFKRNRDPGPENSPVFIYYGTFGPLPLAAGNYHLWDVPPLVRIVDGYAEVDVAAGSAQNAILGIIPADDVGTVAAGENIFGNIAVGAAALFRFVAASLRVQAPNDALRYALVWNREAAVLTNGETFTICLLAIRDDLT